MRFVDTAENAKEREARRKKIAEIEKKEAILQARMEAARIKNRKVGQTSLGETTLSHFGKRR
jgi:transcription elongation GreA/GreB family factor